MAVGKYALLKIISAKKKGTQDFNLQKFSVSDRASVPYKMAHNRQNSFFSRGVRHWTKINFSNERKVDFAPLFMLNFILPHLQRVITVVLLSLHLCVTHITH